MVFEEIAQAVKAKALCVEEKLSTMEITRVYASDLMSDVLAFCQPGGLLITGLTNIQIVRTAQMLDISGILFVRGKAPQEETIKLAREAGIPMILSKYTMFEACGILYALGLVPSTADNEG